MPVPAHVVARIERLLPRRSGVSGWSVGSDFGLSMDHGNGYQENFTKRERPIVVLLFGGDKSSWSREIRTALHLARDPKGR